MHTSPSHCRLTHSLHTPSSPYTLVSRPAPISSRLHNNKLVETRCWMQDYLHSSTPSHSSLIPHFVTLLSHPLLIPSHQPIPSLPHHITHPLFPSHHPTPRTLPSHHPIPSHLPSLQQHPVHDGVHQSTLADNEGGQSGCNIPGQHTHEHPTLRQETF